MRLPHFPSLHNFFGTPVGHFAQIVSITVWTIGLIVQKDLVRNANPASILLLQFAGAAIILWLGLLAMRSLPKANRRSLISFLWGMMAPGMVLILGLYGAARTDGVSISLIWGLVPLLGPALAHVTLREPLPFSFVIGGLVSFVGLIVTTANREAIGASDPTGNFLVFLGVLFAAASHVIGRFLNRGMVPWYQTATLQVSGAAFATLLLTLATGFRFAPADGAAAGLSLAYLVLVMTVVNFLAFNLALARLPAAWISLYVSLVPAIGTIAAVILLGTTVRMVDVAAIAVIMSGVALPHLARLRRRKPRLP